MKAFSLTETRFSGDPEYVGRPSLPDFAGGARLAGGAGET